MTSQRFSNDRVDSNDLKRCFKRILLYSIIAFVVIFSSSVLPVIMQLTPAHMAEIKPNEPIISYFGIEFLGMLMSPGMFMCGVLMALSLFRSLFKKNSVNVYLSFGLTRAKLFFNRTLAAVTEILAAVAIPLTVTLILNVTAFGASTHVFQVYFYLLTGLFVSGVAGYSMMAFICVNTGSLIEAILTAFFLTAIPSRFIALISSLKRALLTGYYVSELEMIGTSKYSFLSPWTILIDTDKTYNPLEDFMFDSSSISSISSRLTGKTVPDDLVLDMGLMLPIIVWTVISVCLIVLGNVLLNKRKAENSNSFGKFYVSSAINGIAVAVYSVSQVIGIISMVFITESEFAMNISPALIIVLLLLISSVTFFLAELLIHRKMRPTLRSLPVLAGLLIVFVGTFVVLNSDYFGTYNKLPAAADIKAVQMDVIDSQRIFSFNTTENIYDEDDPYISTNKDDISLCTKYFEKARDNKRDDSFEGTIGFRIILKNGDEILRKFNIYDEELYVNYAKDVYDSSYRQGLMKYLMIDDFTPPEDYDDSMGYFNDGFGYNSRNSSVRGMYKVSDYYATDSNFLLKNWSFTAGDTSAAISDNEELLEALYKDMSKLSYDEVYYSKVRPVMIIASDFSLPLYENEKLRVSNGEDYIEREYWSVANIDIGNSIDFSEGFDGAKKDGNYIPDTPFFAVYPNMTNTINFLKEHGYTVGESNNKVKYAFVTRDSKSAAVRLNELEKQLHETDHFYFYFEDETVISNVQFAKVIGIDLGCLERTSYFGYLDENFSQTSVNALKKVFEDAGAPLITIDSPEKAEKVLEKSVPFHSAYNDEGRYVYFVYEDGAIVSEYIPEANLGVLK